MLLGLASEAHGGASEFVVTPSNITKQRLTLRVEARPDRFGAVDFHVSVGAATDSVFPSHMAGLGIGEWSAVPSSGHVRVLVPPKMACRLYEKAEGGTLHFDFRLPREWLDQARFTFENSPGGMVGYIYTLPLKDFVLSR
jgi:hypothetical protein